MDTMPLELTQLLGLIFGTVAITGLLKSIAARVDTEIKGYGAVVVSFVVAGLLTALSIVLGWYAVDIPEFTGNPTAYLGDWITLTGGVTAFANVLYMYVYERIKSAA